MAEKKEPESGIEAITVPTPKPPYAMPKMVRGKDGKMHTIYVDPQTDQPISNLTGYTILDGNNYYQVTGAADKDKDGDVDPKETQKATDSALARAGHTTATDADHSGSTFSGSTNPMNNYGYQHKPGAVKYAGYIPGPLGMAAKAVNVGWNANNLAATNTARQMLGLPERTAKSMIGGLLRDNQGQVANVDINGNKYSVGFEAMSPTNRTNLTPMEARNRALTLGGITEDTTAPAKGITKGWATKALDKAFGIQRDPSLPDTAPTPSANPSTRPEAMGTKQTQDAPAPAAGFMSHPSNPLGIGNKDPLGRVTIDKVNFEKIGLNPAMAAKMVDFQKEAVAQGLGKKLSVDVSNTKRTPEQQKAIKEAGFSKTNVSYHNVGLAVDVSPTAVDEKGRIQDEASLAASRALAEKYGFGLLDPSWDPAHIQQTVPGETAASLSKRQVDAWGNIKMSPEEDLGIRQNSVPTPTSNPGPAPAEVDRNYAGQGKVSTAPSGMTGTAAQIGKTKDDAVASSAFRSQDEKANTGNVSGYRSSFVSQDERASLPDRMGVTPSSLDPVGNSLSPTATKSVFDSIGPTSQNKTAQAVQGTISNNDKIGTSPAARAAMGLTNRTVAEKTAMARTIAGELSQGSLKALAANDPKALAEVGNMVATMENRAASKVYSGIPGALQPSQYNSLMASNLAVTNQNYAANKVALDKAIAAAYSGKAIPGVNYNATNYFNPDVSNPAWGSKLKDPTKVGAHVFGSLPEYSPDAAAKAAAAAMGTMAGTSYSPGKMKDDTPGAYAGNGTGTTFGGGAGVSGGAGYTPGGMNSPSGSGFGGGYSNGDSPSERGGRFGGSGLGQGGGSSSGGGNSSTGGGSGYGSGSGGKGTASGGSAGMSGGGGYSPGGMGSPSGSSAGNAGTGGGGLGKNSDGSSNGWGGRSGSV